MAEHSSFTDTCITIQLPLVCRTTSFDVFEKEPPLPIDHLLLSTNRCLVTPHVAFATEESFAARADIVFGHVDDYLK